MKNNTFVIITLLFLTVVYLGDKVVLKRSNELLLLDRVNILESKLDSLKTSYFELESEAIDLSDICDEFKSSREAKEQYYLKK